MEHSEGNGRNAEATQCVRVAVNIRPLITTELLQGCTDCITVAPGEPQVQIGSHIFTYDYVSGSTGSPSSAIYDDCVDPLVDALFNGYNATVLAYGQTGSGKTYTMGTNYSGEESAGGIIPKVMETIFKKVQGLRESTEFLIRVSFIEAEWYFDDSNEEKSDGNGALLSNGDPEEETDNDSMMEETDNDSIMGLSRSLASTPFSPRRPRRRCPDLSHRRLFKLLLQFLVRSQLSRKGRF